MRVLIKNKVTVLVFDNHEEMVEIGKLLSESGPEITRISFAPEEVSEQELQAALDEARIIYPAKV